jgi:iron complex outermembrane receptor protein
VTLPTLILVALATVRTSPGAPPVEPETVVTAPAPAPHALAERAAPADALRDRGAATAAEALEALGAVTAQVNARGERLLSLRGYEQRQVAVLLDGVPLRLPYDGRVDLGKLPLGLLGEVRILAGPAPLDLGPTGMGGALALHTRTADGAPRLSLDGRVGPGAEEAHAAVAWAGRRGGVVAAADLLHRAFFRLPHRFEAERNEDGGRREGSGRTSGSTGLTADWRPAAGHRLRLILAGALGAYDVPPSTTSSTPRYWRFSEYDLGLARLGYAGPWGRRVTADAAVHAALFRNTLVGFDDATCVTRRSDRAFRSTYDDVTAGGYLGVTVELPRPRRWRGLTLRANLDLRQEHHAQRDEATRVPAVAETAGTAGAELALDLPRGHAVRLQGEATFAVPAGAAAPGTRPWAQGGGLVGYGWTHRQVVVAASVSRKLRPPSLRERYASAFGSETPNPTLGPESAWHAQVDVRWRIRPWVALEAAAFGARLDDLIELRPVGDGTRQQRNVGQAALAGGEVGARFRWRYGLEAGVAYQALWMRRIDPAAGESLRPPGRPPHQVRLDLSCRPWRYLSLGTTLLVRVATLTADPDTSREVKLPAFVRWDARVALGPWHGLTVYVQAQNLLDARIETESGYPDPGLMIWVGVQAVVQ